MTNIYGLLVALTRSEHDRQFQLTLNLDTEYVIILTQRVNSLTDQRKV